ncbi:hypothetical protein FQA47_020770, partial [Oryzias melastigma]
MLVKANYGGTKKYIKLQEACFSDFLSAVQEKFLIPETTTLKVTDDQGVEVDEDVFSEVATSKEICFLIYTPNVLTVPEQECGRPSSPSLTDTLSLSSCLSSDTSDSGGNQPMDSTFAKNTVEQILTSKPAGITVIKEYENTRTLKDSTRRLMVNIIVSHMREKEGDTTNACLFLTKVFLFFQEHFYDFQSNTGFLEWRVKTVQRKFRTSSTPHKKVQLRGGPTSPRVSGTSDDQRTGDECMEAISLLQHTTNCDVVFQKMRETFQYRRQILQDPQISADVLKIFPRFLDVKGLILQDFLLMFGAEAASRLLEKWNTSFKEKVIQEAQSLKGSTLLRKYLKAALNEESDTPEEPEWDTDMASLLVLLHLLTPQPAGRKRAKKISVEEATDHLVKFLK